MGQVTFVCFEESIKIAILFTVYGLKRKKKYKLNLEMSSFE